MSLEVRAEAVFRGGMRLEGTSSRSGKTVDIDFAPEGETVAGFTPLELLLTSLVGCSGQVVVGLLKRMGQEVQGLTVRACGAKREIHPTVFTSVELDFEFRGGRVDGAAVEKAFALSEDRFCPVWVMLKASVPITAKYHIVPDSGRGPGLARTGTGKPGPGLARTGTGKPGPGLARGSTSAVLARGYKPRASGEPKARPLTDGLNGHGVTRALMTPSR